MTRKKKIIVGLTAAGTLALVALVATSRSTQKPVTAGEVKPVAVEVKAAGRTTVSELVSAVGSVQAMQDVKVSSETAGRITAVHVKVGDAVRTGTPLVTVDAELKAVAVDQAKAQVLAAATSLEKSKKDFERTEKLYATGDVADVELEGYRLAYHAAEAQHASAKAGLRLAQRQLADTKITSPIDGVVASRKPETGEMVGPGSEIANIVNIATVKVKLSIAEEDVHKLRPGLTARVTVDSRSGEVFEGKVYTIGSKTENSTGHSYPVEVLVQNRGNGSLKVGMFARVQIGAASAPGVLAVSKESLVGDERRPAVFIVDGSVARLRQVKLGLRGDGMVQVTDGLREGDLVITFGQKGLKDGAAVSTR